MGQGEGLCGKPLAQGCFSACWNNAAKWDLAQGRNVNCLRLGDDSRLCLLSDLHKALSECAVWHSWHLSCFTLQGKQFFDHQWVQVKTDTRITWWTFCPDREAWCCDSQKRGGELNSASYINPTLNSEWARDPNFNWQLELVHAKPPPSSMEPKSRAAPALFIGYLFSEGSNLEYEGLIELVARSWTLTNAG